MRKILKMNPKYHEHSASMRLLYKKRKMIDGEIFETSWFPMNREFADRRAYNLRRSGWYARVVLVSKPSIATLRYEVFYRKKSEQR